MLLRIQDRILLGLAFLGDVFENVADAGGLMSFSYKQVYGFVPQKYKKHNFHASVWYALKTGNIEKVFRNGKPHLKLTGQGKKKMIRHFLLFQFQEKDWDRIWRVIPYDIEETKSWQRDRLRERLYELGFRRFQKSIYLSPHPIEDEMNAFLESLNLQGKVRVLLCSKILGVDNKKLAKRLWQLDKLNRNYKNLWEKLGETKEEKDLKRLQREYLELLSIDPFLPKDFLPQDWYEKRARERLKILLKG